MQHKEDNQLQLLLLIQHLSSEGGVRGTETVATLLNELAGGGEPAFDWALSRALIGPDQYRQLQAELEKLLRDGADPSQVSAGLLESSVELRTQYQALYDPMATAMEDTGQDPLETGFEDPNATLDVPEDVEKNSASRTTIADDRPGPRSMESSRQRFQSLRFHARGGLGEIHIAQDDELNREVALKEIRPEYVDDLDSRQRFIMEGEVTGRLEHPGIVPVYGMGSDSLGRPYYAMRFIKGESLADAIQFFHKSHAESSAPLEFQTLLRRFMAVCRTMDYAHSRGVLHRDLKPDNIMLGRYDETLIVDWGLAKIIGRPQRERKDPLSSAAEDRTLHPEKFSDPNATVRGSIAGTLLYMSPEQALGWHDRLSPTADVFSLGAILFELLTGRRLYVADSVEQAQRKAVDCEPQPARQVKPQLPKALEAICLKATAKAPEHRYQSAGDLADDIAAFLADQPITAKQDSFLERAGRWARRNRTAVSAATAAGLVALITLGVSAVILSGKNREIETKNKEVTAQRDQARKNLTLARSAVNDLLGSLADDPRLEAAGLDNLRLQLAKKATPYFKEFLTSTSDDEGIIFEQARLKSTLGEIAFQASSQEEALEYLASVADALERLLAGAPKESNARTYRQMLSRSLTRMGHIKKEWGESSQAFAHYQRALDVAEELSDDSDEGDSEYGTKSLLIAAAKTGIAAMEVNTGKLDSAKVKLVEVNELLLGIEDAAFSRHALNVRRMLAQIDRLQGFGKEALDQLTQVVVDTDRIPEHAVAPVMGATEIEKRNFKSEVLNEIGTLLINDGKSLAAMQSLEETLALARETKRLFPENLMATEMLGITLHNLSTPSHELINRNADLEQLKQRQRDLLEDAQAHARVQREANPKIFATRVNSLISKKSIAHELTNEGKAAEAMAMLEEILAEVRKITREHPEHWEGQMQLVWSLLFAADATSFDRTAWDKTRAYISEAIEIADAEFERTGVVDFLFAVQAGYLRQAQLSSNQLIPNWREVLTHNQARIEVFERSQQLTAPSWRLTQAQTHQFIANAYYAQGDLEGAMEALNDAIAYSELAVESAPAEPNPRMQRFLLGLSRVNLESEMGGGGAMEIAIGLGEEAKVLVDIDPQWIRTDIFETLVEAMPKMAEHAQQNGLFRQQKQQLESVVQVLDELFVRNRDRRDLIRKAELQLELAMATFGAGDEDGFLVALDEARASAMAYLELQPRSQNARAIMAQSLIRAGEFYTLQEEHAKAFQQYDQAVEVDSKKLFNKSRIYRAKSTVRLGNYLSAIDDIRRLQSLGNLSADELFDVAAVYGLAIDAAENDLAEPDESTGFGKALRDRLMADSLAALQKCFDKASEENRASYIQIVRESGDFAAMKNDESFQRLIEDYVATEAL